MKKLNPIEQSKHIEKKFREYIQSTFDIADETYQKEFEEELKKAKLVKGPYISAELPFEKGHTIHELIEQDKLSKEFLKLSKIDFNLKLYSHQEKSLELISKGDNVVITTGTGSGKTECFLYPILNHILREIEEGKGGPGIVSLFLYPMNALVNDQIDRVRDILRNYPQITFGFFTGDTAEDDTTDLRKKLSEKYGTEIPNNEIVSREEIRKNPPNLLFTNYSMLEYLLIRPTDVNLFSEEKAKRWQYIVLDEAHTYSGAMGIEIAILLRRVRGIANKNPQMILTSATLGDENKDIDKILQFAKDLTTSNFTKEDIIFARREKLKNSRKYRIPAEEYSKMVECYDDKDKLISILKRTEDLNFDEKENSDEILYDVLINDENVQDLYHLLKTNNIKNFEEILKEINNIKEFTSKELIDLIFLISKANKNNDSIFDSKYHTFVRTLDGAFVTIGDEKKMKLTNSKTIDDMTTFEIGLCQYCNQMYIMGKIYNNKLNQNVDTDIDENYADIVENVNVDYFLLADKCDVHENHKDDVEEYVVCSKCANIYAKGDLNAKDCKCGENYKVALLKIKDEKKRIKNNLSTCVCCNRFVRKGVGIVQGFHLSKDSATALLAQILYETLDEKKETEKDNNVETGNWWEINIEEENTATEEKSNTKAKQFIAFSDSRQQASFFATFYDHEHKRFLRKRIIWEELQENNHEEMSVSKLLAKLTNRIFENKLFDVDDEEEAEKQAWITILVELLNIDGRNSAEGLGIYKFKLNEESIKREIDKNGGLTKFLEKYEITEKEFFDILQVLLKQFRDTSSLNYKEAGLDPTTRKEELAYRRFENYGVELIKPDKDTKGENRFSFLPKGKMKNKNYKYIENVLGNKEQEEIVEFMRLIWNLSRKCGIFHEEIGKQTEEKLCQIEAKKYVVDSYKNNEYYYCPVCRRITPYNVRRVCPTYRCNGRLEECDPDDKFKNNYYRKEYMNKKIENINVQEHTAQINKDEGRKYQNDFKNQKINILSCSTTFELGIDIGKLENVFLRNVPPTPANYAQRAGRAGRSKDASAFVLTYCGASSHDFTYFSDPTKMIAGHIVPPHFKTTNEKLLIRHITASAFGFFFKKYPEYFSNVEALICNGGIEKIITYLNSKPTDLLKYIDNKVLSESDVNLKNFKWLEDLTKEEGTLNQYKQHISENLKDLEEAKEKAKKEDEFSVAKYYENEINKEKQKNVINSLSEFCIIPKYGFPVDVVDLKVIDPNGKKNYDYNLSRDLSIAISEYAPDSEIVVAKKKYTSRYIVKPRGDVELTKYFYYTCEKCERLNVSTIKDKIEKCIFCGETYNQPINQYFIEPRNGFATDKNNKESTSKKPKKTYAGEYKYLYDGIKDDSSKIVYNDNYVVIESAKDAELLIINENKFYMCRYCGYTELKKDHNGNLLQSKHKDSIGYECKCDTLERVSLGHKFKTDVVKIKIKNLTEKKHALSFLYGVLEGISENFDIERRDINGIINKDGEYYEIIVFDNVPGGAGHVKRILDKEELKNVVKSAYHKVNLNCCDEETSCYNCLRNYNNQRVHKYLKRRYAKEVLRDVLKHIDDKYINRDINLSEAINISKSFPLDEYSVWEEIQMFINNIPINEFINRNIILPDYGESIIQIDGKEIRTIAIWKSENIVIFGDEVTDSELEDYNLREIKAYRKDNINYDEIKEIIDRSKNG